MIIDSTATLRFQISIATYTLAAPYTPTAFYKPVLFSTCMSPSTPTAPGLPIHSYKTCRCFTARHNFHSSTPAHITACAYTPACSLPLLTNPFLFCFCFFSHQNTFYSNLYILSPHQTSWRNFLIDNFLIHFISLFISL